MTSNAARVMQEGLLDNQTVILGDGTPFDLGRPGTRRYARRRRRYIRTRLRHEPAFRKQFSDKYDRRGRER